MPVVGIDADPDKVKMLSEGRSYINHVPGSDIAELLEAKKFSPSSDFGRIKGVEAVVICVPTPLNRNREPDLSYVLQTGRSIGKHL